MFSPRRDAPYNSTHMWRERARRIAVFAAAALVWFVCADCNREDAPSGRKAASQPFAPVAPPTNKPDYTFSESVRDEYPDVVAFLQQFLETCLAGDYAGYRRLVSRSYDPESRDRFERIFHAVRTISIDTVEPVEIPHVPPPCYLVTGSAEFHANQRVALRRGEFRRIAILVFKEEGEWRMVPAPGELQPHDEPEPASQPDEPPPVDYPWDEGGDY